jgi:hypothetical protein
MSEAIGLPKSIEDPSQLIAAGVYAAEIADQNKRAGLLDSPDLKEFPEFHAEVTADLTAEQAETFSNLVEATDSLPFEQIELYRRELNDFLRDLDQQVKELIDNESEAVDAVLAVAIKIKPDQRENYLKRREELIAARVNSKVAPMQELRRQTIVMQSQVEEAFEAASSDWSRPTLVNPKDYYSQESAISNPVDDSMQLQDFESKTLSHDGSNELSADEGRIHLPDGEVVIVAVDDNEFVIGGITSDDGENRVEEIVAVEQPSTSEIIVEVSSDAADDAAAKAQDIGTEVDNQEEAGEKDQASTGANTAKEQAVSPPRTTNRSSRGHPSRPSDQVEAYSIVPSAISYTNGGRADVRSRAAKSGQPKPKSLLGDRPTDDVPEAQRVERKSATGANEWLELVRASVADVFQGMASQGMLVGTHHSFDFVQKVNGKVPMSKGGEAVNTAVLTEELKARHLADPSIESSGRLTVRDYVVMQLMRDECIANVLPSNPTHPDYEKYVRLVLRAVDTSIGKCYAQLGDVGSRLQLAR